MRKKHIKIGISCIVLLAFFFLTYRIFFETTYSEGAFTTVDVPPWLLGELSIDTSVTDEISGPTILSEKDSYCAFKIRFYDTSTQKLITDKLLLNHLISMFTYTDEPFIYDETRSSSGYCFFYYNKILSANESASLFSGFKGDEDNLFGIANGIDNFYIKVQGSTIPVSFSEDFEEILDTF